MDPARKTVQAIRIVLLVSVAIYVLIGERMGQNTPDAPDRNFYFAATLIALTTVGMTFAVWRLFVLRSEAALAAQPEDGLALKRWRVGYIFTYALCEAVALFGLVLRILGFTLSEVVPFYIVGFVLMILFSPHRSPSGIAKS
jgi:hypothetical protein